MSAFSAMVSNITEQRHTPAPGYAPQDRVRSHVRTDALLRVLRETGAAMTSRELADAVGCDSGLIWGLLKYHSNVGRVRYDGEHWQINAGFIGVDERRAAELLRSMGWTAIEPGRVA